MAQTYRGARVSDIVDALEKTSQLFGKTNIGPICDSALRSWTAAGGPVEQLCNGADPKSIMEGKNSPIWMAGVVLPAVERLALLGKRLNGVDAMDAYQALGRAGFLGQARITLMTPEDAEVGQFIQSLPPITRDARLPQVDTPLKRWYAEFPSMEALKVARERFTQKVAELGKGEDMGMHGIAAGNSLMVESTGDVRKVFKKLYPNIKIMGEREMRQKIREERRKKNPPKPPKAHRRRRTPLRRP